jgi:hypothetical protein
LNPAENQKWGRRLRPHDRTLLTAVAGVLLLYLIGLVAVIRSAFRPLEDNLKTLQRRLKDSDH